MLDRFNYLKKNFFNIFQGFFIGGIFTVAGEFTRGGTIGVAISKIL